MWAEGGGLETRGHLAAALWLWRAHNMVRARLAQDASTSGKEQWPSVAECEECYLKEARKGTGGLAPNSATEWQSEGVWDETRVFAFLQETFCFQSDTLSCAQFYDPSMQTNDEGVFMWSIITGTLFTLLGLLVCCDPFPTVLTPEQQQRATEIRRKAFAEAADLQYEANRDGMDSEGSYNSADEEEWKREQEAKAAAKAAKEASPEASAATELFIDNSTSLADADDGSHTRTSTVAPISSSKAGENLHRHRNKVDDSRDIVDADEVVERKKEK